MCIKCLVVPLDKTMKFGIIDVLDGSWAWNNKGPIIFDRLDEAVIAAKSISLEFKIKSRFLPKEYPSDGLIKVKTR